MALAHEPYRTCALCKRERHPDDVYQFPAGALSRYPVNICWDCIEAIADGDLLGSDRHLGRLKVKLAG